jgi:hypothetical protein
MITSSPVNSSSLSSPYRVYKSTTTGLVGGTSQVSAITTIILCNTGTPNLTDETVQSASVSIHLAKAGIGAKTSNLVVSNLTVPAGETVFFSEERLILDGNDEIWIGSTSGGTESAGAFVIGANYTILTIGGTPTDFTLIGAADNNIGTHFTASGVGSGAGTAIRNLVSVTVSSLPV